MKNNFAETLESYVIEPANELYVDYFQDYDENFKREKVSLNDFTILIINESNYSQISSQYRKLDLPWFNKKHMLKEGVIWVRVLTKDPKPKVVATADVWNAKLAMDEKVARFDSKPYDERKTYLQDLSVRKEFQGRGIGKQLLKFMISKLNIGYCEIFAESQVALKVYQSVGFKTYETRDGVYFLKR